MTGFVLIVWGSLKTIGGVFWRLMKNPPACYVCAGCLVLLALWGAQAIGYRSGVAAQKRAAAVRSAQIEKSARTVAARAEDTSMANIRLVYRNQEVVRYVTRKAAGLPDGGTICIPADLADRLRGLE
ncbi:MAG: hypothetical protein WCD42_05315 [Rhizomicrobium sp.]